MAGFIATVNVPGYLPMDSEPPFVFAEARTAWQHLISEVNDSWEQYPNDESGGCVEAHAQMHSLDQSQPGSVWAPTPGPELIHDLGLVYAVIAVDDEPDDKEAEE